MRTSRAEKRWECFRCGGQDGRERARQTAHGGDADGGAKGNGGTAAEGDRRAGRRGVPHPAARRDHGGREVGDISSRTEQQPYAARRTRTGGPGMGAPDCAWRGFLCCGRRGGQSKGRRRETRCVGAWADAPDMGLRDLARGGMRRAALEFGRKSPRRHAPRRLRKGALFKIVQDRGIASAAGLAHFNGLVKGEKYRGGMLRGGWQRRVIQDRPGSGACAGCRPCPFQWPRKGRKPPRRHAPRRLRKGALFKIVQGRGIASAAGLAHFDGLVKGENRRGGMLRGDWQGRVIQDCPGSGDCTGCRPCPFQWPRKGRKIPRRYAPRRLAKARYSRSSRVGGLRRLQALPISMAS